MRALSNLPPGCTDRDIEEAAGAFDEPQLSRRQIADKIEALSSEIDWNIRRLGNLILSDDDREQVEDLIQDLREEQQTLKLALRNAAR